MENGQRVHARRIGVDIAFDNHKLKVHGKEGRKKKQKNKKTKNKTKQNPHTQNVQVTKIVM